MYGGDITQQGTSGGTIKDRSERGAFGKVLHQQIVEALLKKVNISTPKQVGLREGRTLSLILNPSAVTSTGVTERSMHVKKGGPIKSNIPSSIPSSLLSDLQGIWSEWPVTSRLG